MSLRAFCWPCTPAGLFPAPPLLVLPGGVWDRLSNGDILRLLFTVTPELMSLLVPLFLLWGPVTNSSASSIIIPCVAHARTWALQVHLSCFCKDLLPFYPAWKGFQMCVAVWVGQGRFLSEETASFSGTPDNSPSEPQGRCGESLTESNAQPLDKSQPYIVTSCW